MDITLIMQGAAALALVLALILGVAWALKRHFGGNARPGNPGVQRRNRRLGVVEAAPLGSQHRLVLVRRDDVEHLLLIGGGTEIVIEAGIPREARSAATGAPVEEPRFESAPYPPPAIERERDRDRHIPDREAPVARGFAREPFERASFDRDFRGRDDVFDRREEPGFARDEEAGDDSRDRREQGFPRRESVFDRGFAGSGRSERSYEPPEPPLLGRSQRAGMFSDREPPFRDDDPGLEPAPDRDEPDDDYREYDDREDYDDLEARDRYDRDLPDAERDVEDEEEPEEDAQSRILSRFLKRDES